MKVKQIISTNVSGNRMEVTAEEDINSNFSLKDTMVRTLHIHKEGDIWKYFVGYDNKGTKIYAPIIT